MLQFFSHLFGGPDAVAGAQSTTTPTSDQLYNRAQNRKDLDHKVVAIETHLDENFPYWRLQSAPYNLIDWNLTPEKRMTSPIYLGSALALTDDHFLRNVGAVLTIIDPGRCPKEAVHQLLRQASDSPKSHLYLPLDDDPREDISKYFDQAAQFIEYHQQRGVPVLVHCMAGMSRSATLLANYLMKKYNISAMTALDLMKKRRPIVRPNSGFIRQLVLQEKK